MSGQPVDIDGDGIADGTAVDLDGDGVDDAISTTDAEGNNVLIADVNGDGLVEYYADSATDCDDEIDQIGLDLDGDTDVDALATDIDHDGTFDEFVVDVDGDGVADLEVSDPSVEV